MSHLQADTLWRRHCIPASKMNKTPSSHEELRVYWERPTKGYIQFNAESDETREGLRGVAKSSREFREAFRSPRPLGKL